MIRSIALVVALASLASFAGCKSEEAKAKPAAEPAPAAKVQAEAPQPKQAATVTVEEGKKLCVEMFTRSRTCTDDYIPALVDARARHDVPPGITEEVKKDRNAVIAAAKGEWANDSKDEVIAAMCDQLTEKAIAEDPGSVDTLKGCLTKQACGEFVSCIMPIHEKRFAK